MHNLLLNIDNKENLDEVKLCLTSRIPNNNQYFLENRFYTIQ